MIASYPCGSGGGLLVRYWETHKPAPPPSGFLALHIASATARLKPQIPCRQEGRSAYLLHTFAFQASTTARYLLKCRVKLTGSVPRNRKYAQDLLLSGPCKNALPSTSGLLHHNFAGFQKPTTLTAWQPRKPSLRRASRRSVKSSTGSEASLTQ